MRSKVFLAVTCLGLITASMHAGSITKTQEVATVIQDRTIAALPDSALVLKAELLFEEAAALLNSLKPTLFISKQRLADNKEVIFKDYMRVVLADKFKQLCDNKRRSNNLSSEDQLPSGILIQTAEEFLQSLISVHQNELTSTSLRTKTETVNKLKFYKLALEELVSMLLISPECHVLYVRYYTQRLLDAHTIAQIAVQDQTKSKSKGTA